MCNDLMVEDFLVDWNYAVPQSHTVQQLTERFMGEGLQKWPLSKRGRKKIEWGEKVPAFYKGDIEHEHRASAWLVLAVAIV